MGELHEASHWYVVRTKSKQEDRASANLIAWQVQTFTPKVKEKQATGFGSHYVSKPLFSRYIFAHFDADRLLHHINYTRGVENVLSFDGKPVPVEDGVIDLIKERVDEDGFVRLGEELKFGDRIRISSGPFKNLVGIFHGRVNNNDRVRILLNAVQYQTQLLIDRDLIERTHQGPT